jgi:hypothetical protein
MSLPFAANEKSLKESRTFSRIPAWDEETTTDSIPVADEEHSSHQLKFLALSIIILWALSFSPETVWKQGIITSRSRCL